MFQHISAEMSTATIYSDDLFSLGGVLRPIKTYNYNYILNIWLQFSSLTSITSIYPFCITFLGRWRCLLSLFNVQERWCYRSVSPLPISWLKTGPWINSLEPTMAGWLCKLFIKCHTNAGNAVWPHGFNCMQTIIHVLKLPNIEYVSIVGMDTIEEEIWSISNVCADISRVQEKLLVGRLSCRLQLDTYSNS